MSITVVSESSHAGGGSLPEVEFPTFCVSLRPRDTGVNEIESRLRGAPAPVVARIRDDRLILDARTVMDEQVNLLVESVVSAIKSPG